VVVRDVHAWYKDMVKYIQVDFPAKVQECRKKLNIGGASMSINSAGEEGEEVVDVEPASSFWASIVGSNKKHSRVKSVEHDLSTHSTDRCSMMEIRFNELLSFLFGGDSSTVVTAASMWKERYSDHYDEILSLIPRERRKLIDLFSTEAGSTDRTWHWLARWLGVDATSGDDEEAWNRYVHVMCLLDICYWRYMCIYVYVYVCLLSNNLQHDARENCCNGTCSHFSNES
jgi:hypothetical protein